MAQHPQVELGSDNTELFLEAKEYRLLLFKYMRLQVRSNGGVANIGTGTLRSSGLEFSEKEIQALYHLGYSAEWIEGLT